MPYDVFFFWSPCEDYGDDEFSSCWTCGQWKTNHGRNLVLSHLASSAILVHYTADTAVVFWLLLEKACLHYHGSPFQSNIKLIINLPVILLGAHQGVHQD